MNLEAKAAAWLNQDPDPATKAELAAILGVGDAAALESRFASRLQFGTAGLRGELGAGPNRMNRVVVAQAAFAIAKFLQSNKAVYQNSKGGLSVVIGFDGRVNSDVFAADSAQIIAAAGIEVLLFDAAVPTPVAAFTGRQGLHSATIVVTASHNPPRDNGYKVYLGGPNGGSQLISPQDGEIAKLIDEIAETTTFDEIPKSDDYQVIGQLEIDAYVARAKQLLLDLNPNRESLKITYTAMHGVGHRIVKQLFSDCGFRYGSVEKQQEPDGAFPTVAFPNPEEPGAMDLSFEHALASQSDVIIANDPDADRLAVGVLHEGKYQMLTGDQVGLLLAETKATPGGVLANSIVSASLAKVAKHHSMQYTQTLTGFKWISKVPNLTFGYEEALGYCVDPEATPDKDGITAALLMAELAANKHAQGLTLIDYLDELAERYGHQATGQVSIRVTDLSIIGKIMQGVRSNPPAQVLGEGAGFEDLLLGVNLPSTDGLILTTERYRVIIRPSGTEPKLKCYLQVVGQSAQLAQQGLDDLKAWANQLLASYQ